MIAIGMQRQGTPGSPGQSGKASWNRRLNVDSKNEWAVGRSGRSRRSRVLQAEEEHKGKQE